MKESKWLFGIWRWSTWTAIKENISAVLSDKDDEEAIKNTINGVRLKH